MRVGKFSLLSAIVLSGEAPEIFKLLEFVPFRAELIFYPQGKVDYLGISPLFDDIEDGTIAPDYVVTLILNDLNEKITIRVERI